MAQILRWCKPAPSAAPAGLWLGSNPGVTDLCTQLWDGLASLMQVCSAPKDGAAPRRRPLAGPQRPEQMHEGPSAPVRSHRGRTRCPAAPSTAGRRKMEEGKSEFGVFFNYGMIFSPVGQDADYPVAACGAG